LAGVAKQNRHLRGRLAEGLAFALLVAKGYHVLATNARGSHAEIDILAQRHDTLCFIEVKYRRSLEAASLAIHPAQKDRQWQQAMATARRYRHTGPVRFEAVLVFAHWPFVRHLKNVYGDIG
jgi:putative endonuclease